MNARDIRDILRPSSISITERDMNRAPVTAIDRAMARLAETRGQAPAETPAAKPTEAAPELPPETP